MTLTKDDWKRVQANMGQRYTGSLDGDPGPKTWSGLLAIAAPTSSISSDQVQGRARALASNAVKFDLVTGPRIAGFLSNIAHETGDFYRGRENLNYSTPEQIRRSWPSRFPTVESAKPFTHNPQGLANKVYARPSEGNTRPGDGWLFRGGGDIQLTFASNYREIGNDIGVPLYEHPELIELPSVSSLAALAYWKRHGLSKYYDLGQSKKGRALINTGNPDSPEDRIIGLADVEARYHRLTELFK